MGIPVYIVSLRRDISRRSKIAADLTRIGVDFIFFDAVDAKDECNSQILNAMKNSGDGSSMTNGELACTLSHQRIYQKMVAQGIEWAVILEDDVVVDDRFKDLWLSLNQGEYKNLYCDNIYLLGGQKGLHEYPVLATSIISKLKIGKINFRRVNYNINKIRRTCCYLLSNSMSRDLLALTENYGTYRADSWKLMYNRGIIKDFYLSEIISHPIVNDFNSHLESERSLISVKKIKRTKFQKIMKLTRSWVKVCFFSLFR